MSLFQFLLLGMVIGIITSAPVGPVNVMAMRHAIQRGAREGLLVGFGAVIADVIYATVAIFGVSVVTGFIEGQVDIIKLLGGALLVVFGARVFTSHPHLEKETSAADLWSDATGAFFLTLTNPGAVLGFIAIIGGLGSWRPAAADHFGAAAMVAGVALGATAWWALISSLVSRFSARLDDRWLEKANRIAGTLLVLFGLLVFADLALAILN
ncbi:LysE family translocator [Roseibium sp.]|uniref:LysE family translocator n=1 Tax=Roseibium sp. TaxID=1936156 RepID=UPI003A98652D